MEEEIMYPRECECGKVIERAYMWDKHVTSKRHADAMEAKGFVKNDEGEFEALPDDLQAIVDMKDRDPRFIGKMLRYAFAQRGWPNKQHPGTVLDFMKEHNLPMFNLGRGHWSASEGDSNIVNQVKEYMGVR